MEEAVKIINYYMITLCRFMATTAIAVGIFKTLLLYAKHTAFGADAGQAIQRCRLELGHAFSLGLGFLIGAGILRTSPAPSWNEIGKLAAIITIRMGLNLLLLKEISTQTIKLSGLAVWPFGRRKTDRIEDLKVCDCSKSPAH